MSSPQSQAPGTVVERIAGSAVAVRGDDIDTDRIIPARFLRCVTFDGIGEHAFEDDRLANAGEHPFDRPEFGDAEVLVVNGNFGCGSSREHAPQSLMRWGIRGIVGESFAEIFFGNCVALGVPCVVAKPADVDRLQAAIEAEPRLAVEIDLSAQEVTARGGAAPLRFAIELPKGARESFLAGTWDATALLLDKPSEVDAVARRLPYVTGFSA